jgi:2'-5' RNA ligase
MTKIFRPFMDNKAGQHDYSSVQVNVPQVLAIQMVKWGEKHIPDKELYNPNSPAHGRESEMHITLLYGIHSKTSNKVEALLKDEAPFTVKLGNISVFTTNDDFDVIKVEADGPKLFDLNRLLKNNIVNTQSFPSYKPHITIAYVKKGAGKDLVGNGEFREIAWTANTIIFSSMDGHKVPIRLK